MDLEEIRLKDTEWFIWVRKGLAAASGENDSEPSSTIKRGDSGLVTQLVASLKGRRTYTVQ
jgi:hypothetical protein